MEPLSLDMSEDSKKQRSTNEKEEYINVGVRFRPLNSREQARNEETEQEPKEYFEWTKNSITPLFAATRSERSRQSRANENRSGTTGPASVVFNFDRVFAPGEPTQAVYDEMTSNLVASAMGGVHSAVFAFGQTSTGKTFTMQGTARSPGIIPRAVEDVFEYVYNNPDREFLLRVSYLEVYNESINDLLNPTSSNLRVFEDKVRGPYVNNLEEKVVVTPEQIFSLIAAGEAQRHIGATNFNQQSSRSHTIFRLVIESKVYQNNGSAPGTPVQQSANSRSNRNKNSTVQVATLNLVDLAGSESAHGTRTTQHKQEGSYINKSLLTLTHVIFKLSDLAQAAKKREAKQHPASFKLGTAAVVHIPYRDSKLTRILQPALQGNSRIAIVCTVTPWGGVKEETLNTLRFATRAKKVRRVAHINQVKDDRALMLQYKEEIAELRRQLAEARRQSVSGGSQVPSTPTGTSLASPESGGNTVDVLLREQIDQAIRNLNRVILNSTLTDSERKRVKQHPRTGAPHPMGPVKIPMDDDMPDTQVPFFQRSRSSGSQTSSNKRESSQTEEHHDQTQNNMTLNQTNVRKSIDEQTVKQQDIMEHRNECRAESPFAMLDTQFSHIQGRHSEGGQKLLESKARKLKRSLSFDGASLKLLSQSFHSRNSGPHHHVVASELKTIRDHLEGLLHGVTSRSPKQASIPMPSLEGIIAYDQEVGNHGTHSHELSHPARDASKPDKEYIAELEEEISNLKRQAERNVLESNVSRADRSFLEDLLKEKDRTINEWTAVIKDIEDRQTSLEAENLELRKKLEAAGLE